MNQPTEQGGGMMLGRHAGTLVLVTVLACCVGCGGPQPAEVKKAEPPAKVGNPVKETELGTITLSPEAEGRLAIKTAVVERKKVARARTYGGETVLPPGQSLTLTSPVAGKISTTPGAAPLTGGATVRQGQALLRVAPLLAPERDMLAVAEKDVASGEARLEAARARVKRAEQLLRDEAGSARSLEDARMELALAEAEVKSARTRLERIKTTPLETEASLTIEAPRDGIIRQVHVAPGETVAASAVLLEVATLNPIWIRVPVYVGDLDSIDPQSPAVVQSLAGRPGSAARHARRISAPPSADPSTDTADFFFELPNSDRSLRPGERVSARLALLGHVESLVVPRSALVYDVHGGTWVYENSGPHAFVRRRVELGWIDGATAVLARGPDAGRKVVTAGVAELFGLEFGAGK
jgi:membrane fusion protein, heavy metal efflux system